MSHPKVLHLSVASYDDLAEMRTELERAFAKFRNSAEFRKRVRGAVVVFEVTHSANGWHLHIHALVDCVWWKQSEMAALWQKCCKARVNPAAQWIEEVRSKAGVSGYLQGYLSKGVDLRKLGTRQGAELVRVWDRFRTLRTYGTCYGCSRRDRGPRYQPVCESCGSDDTELLVAGVRHTVACCDLGLWTQGGRRTGSATDAT